MLSRLVVWGGLENLDSLRWIQKAFYENAQKLGIPAFWVKNEPESIAYLFPGDTVITADVIGTHLPYMKGVNYVLHNFGGDHPLCRQLEDTPERLLRLQVWTNEAEGDDWNLCRRFHKEARTLFQPWGSDLLEEEFMVPAFNRHSKDVVFIGAVWSDQYNGVELGNENEIAQLQEACNDHGLTLVLATQIDQEEMVALTRSARLAPVIVGQWQCDRGYLPCRAFKTPAYGVPCFTNSLPVNELFGADPWDPSVYDVVHYALNFTEGEYTDLVLADQDVAALFTYRESLASIERAFEEMR